jgi:outer membrane cobalamin receptor
VVDPDGGAVARARVFVVSGTTVLASAETDGTGAFTVAAPDSGAYQLRVAADGFAASPLSLTASPEPKDLGSIRLAISAVSESIVVSAAQVDVPLSTTAASVTVLSGEELRARQIESVADALRFVPGITVAATGGRGAVTGVFPRGGESNYSLVLVDGIQANTFGGGFDFGQLAAVNVDRIEIVRGPQSALHGSYAIGAVINIVTRRGGPPTASALVEGGSFDTARMTAATSGSRARFDWGLSTEWLQSDGMNGRRSSAGEVISNDDYERSTFAATGGWRWNDRTHVRADVRYGYDERGFPGPFGSNPAGFYEGIDTISRGENDRWLMGVEGAFAPASAVRIQAGLTHSRLDSDFVSPFGDSVSSSRRTTGRVQADMFTGRAIELSAGGEVQRERAGSTFITITGGTPTPIERTIGAVFAEGRWHHANRAYVTAGLRAERIARDALGGDDNPFGPRPDFADDTITSVNPKISAAWFVRPGTNFTKIRGSAGTGIKPPDAFDIAFTDNPALKPERSRSADVGVDQALANGLGRLEATAFFNNYDDLIVAVGSFAGSSRYRTDNISNARSRGLELAGTIRARARVDLQLRVAYTLLDTEILAIDNSLEAPAPFVVGEPLIRRPKHQFSTDAVITAGRLTAFLQGGGRSQFQDVEPSAGTFGGLFDAPGFTTWDAGASWKLISTVEIFGRVTNLFDREYEEVFGFPAPPRGVVAGLRVAAGR